MTTNSLRDLSLFVNDRTHAVELLKFINNHNGVVFSAIREHIDIYVPIIEKINDLKPSVS